MRIHRTDEGGNVMTARQWDPSENLDTPERIEAWLETAASDDDPAYFRQAVLDAAKAEGMSLISRRTGIPRQTLYRSFGAQGNPSYEMVRKVVKALGGRLTITPTSGHEHAKQQAVS